MNEQIEDLLAVYVLGGLTPDEEAEVEAYVAANPQAAALLEEAYAAAALLPYTAQPLEPSAEAEAALFARIEAASKPQTAPAPTAKRPTQTKPTFWDTMRHFFSLPVVTAVGLGTAVLLLIWNLSLNQQLQNLNQDVQQLATDNNALRTDFDTLANENLSLTARVAELQAANQAYENQIDDMAKNNADLIAANNNLQAEVAETAVKQAKAGERTQARNLLLELVELEPKHELAWLWLSELVEEPEDKIIALENALTINPHRPQTQARLSKLRAKYEAARQPAAEHFATNGFSVVATIEEVEIAEIQQELTNGQMQAGREQLAGFLRRYANHEAGWWLMVKYADTQSNQLIALDHVLRLNRQHPEAPMVLDQITPTVKDSLALGRIYERLEQWEKSEYYYKRALVSSSNADRLLAKKHLTHVSEQVRLGNIKYTSPAATVVRLAAGPMLLYTLL
ncbi:MAG: hypothetical protein KC434_12980, partial [Anaerolineales bacterium]|nr:hypothetical protein [Anaerolineales bacterium]